VNGPPPVRRADVVVVGAGLSGLVAAHELLRAGIDACVVEARDRVGGRLLNEPLGDQWPGEVVELGGQWVGPGQHAIAALASELGLTTFPTHDEGRHIVRLRGRTRSYSGRIPRIGPARLVDVALAQRRLERLARTVPLDRPWDAPDALALDAETFEGWIARSCRTEGGRQFFRVVSAAVWAADPSSISLLHILFYVHSAGGLDPLLDTSGGAQQDRIVGGSQAIALRLAERIGTDRLLLSTPVREVSWGPETVRAESPSVAVEARRAVLTGPPTLLGRISYDPPLPAVRDLLTQRVPNGAVVKCMAVYERPFWRDDGLSGQAASDEGPVQVVFDNSPPSGVPGVLLAFLEGSHAVRLSSVSLEERRRIVIDALAAFFGPRARSPLRYLERDWSAEEWTRGCYGGHLPPGVWTQLGPALRRPVGPLHWAGSETGERWSGYMDGAVESGERAAAEVLASL
jgi:monoamine oxidase